MLTTKQTFRLAALLGALALGLTVAAAAFDGGTTYGPDEVAGFVLGPADAPAGTEYVVAGSGAQDVESFASDDGEKAILRAHRFLIAHTALFASPGLFDGNAGPGAHAIQTFGAVFATDDDARRMFTWYRTRFIPKNGDGLRPLPLRGLGEDESGVSFESFLGFPLPGAAYLWRESNVVLVALALGAPNIDTPGEAIAIAKKIDARIG